MSKYNVRTARVVTMIWALVALLTASSAAAHYYTRHAEPSLRVGFIEQGSILQFFSTGEELDHVEAHLLIPEGTRYRSCYVGTLMPEGGPPRVESVFLLRPRGMDTNALAILVSYDAYRPAIGTQGYLYRTLIFADSPCNRDGLERLHDVEAQVPMGFSGVREGEEVDYPYTTAGAIRQAVQ